MIKTVIFDLGGVLVDLDMDLCFKNVDALGVDMDALRNLGNDELHGSGIKGVGATICDGVSATGLIHVYQVGGVSTEDFIRAMQGLCRPGTTYNQVLDAWNSCLLTIPQYKLDFIKELRAEGYHTYLLSNTNDAHWQYFVENILQGNVDEYFEKAFLSQKLRLAKPNAEIYEAVLAQIPTPAGECLFLDDSRINCEAAEALGIHTYVTPVRTDYREDIRRILSD